MRHSPARGKSYSQATYKGSHSVSINQMPDIKLLSSLRRKPNHELKVHIRSMPIEYHSQRLHSAAEKDLNSLEESVTATKIKVYAHEELKSHVINRASDDLISSRIKQAKLKKKEQGRILKSISIPNRYATEQAD